MKKKFTHSSSSQSSSSWEKQDKYTSDLSARSSQENKSARESEDQNQMNLINVIVANVLPDSSAKKYTLTMDPPYRLCVSDLSGNQHFHHIRPTSRVVIESNKKTKQHSEVYEKGSLKYEIAEKISKMHAINDEENKIKKIQRLKRYSVYDLEKITQIIQCAYEFMTDPHQYGIGNMKAILSEHLTISQMPDSKTNIGFQLKRDGVILLTLLQILAYGSSNETLYRELTFGMFSKFPIQTGFMQFWDQADEYTSRVNRQRSAKQSSESQSSSSNSSSDDESSVNSKQVGGNVLTVNWQPSKKVTFTVSSPSNSSIKKPPKLWSPIIPEKTILIQQPLGSCYSFKLTEKEDGKKILQQVRKSARLQQSKQKQLQNIVERLSKQKQKQQQMNKSKSKSKYTSKNKSKNSQIIDPKQTEKQIKIIINAIQKIETQKQIQNQKQNDIAQWLRENADQIQFKDFTNDDGTILQALTSGDLEIRRVLNSKSNSKKINEQQLSQLEPEVSEESQYLEKQQSIDSNIEQLNRYDALNNIKPSDNQCSLNGSESLASYDSAVEEANRLLKQQQQQLSIDQHQSPNKQRNSKQLRTIHEVEDEQFVSNTKNNNITISNKATFETVAKNEQSQSKKKLIRHSEFIPKQEQNISSNKKFKTDHRSYGQYQKDNYNEDSLKKKNTGGNDNLSPGRLSNKIDGKQSASKNSRLKQIQARNSTKKMEQQKQHSQQQKSQDQSSLAQVSIQAIYDSIVKNRQFESSKKKKKQQQISSSVKLKRPMQFEKVQNAEQDEQFTPASVDQVLQIISGSPQKINTLQYYYPVVSGGSSRKKKNVLQQPSQLFQNMNESNEIVRNSIKLMPFTQQSYQQQQSIQQHQQSQPQGIIDNDSQNNIILQRKSQSQELNRQIQNSFVTQIEISQYWRKNRNRFLLTQSEEKRLNYYDIPSPVTPIPEIQPPKNGPIQTYRVEGDVVIITRNYEPNKTQTQQSNRSSQKQLIPVRVISANLNNNNNYALIELDTESALDLGTKYTMVPLRMGLRLDRKLVMQDHNLAIQILQTDDIGYVGMTPQIQQFIQNYSEVQQESEKRI